MLGFSFTSLFGMFQHFNLTFTGPQGKINLFQTRFLVDGHRISQHNEELPVWNINMHTAPLFQNNSM